MKRIVIPELLDTDAGSPREVSQSLADIESFNRHLGGVNVMASLIQAVASREGLRSATWLDVAGAKGGVAKRTAIRLGRRGLNVQPTLLDLSASHLDQQTSAICGDALGLPFRDNSFDVVGCCLFLHHLEPEQAVKFIRDGLRVARHALVINDLIRHPLHLMIAAAGKPVYRSRLTRHDAPASVRRAYTVDEMREMLRSAGVPQIEITRHFFFRMGAIAWKRPNTI